MSKEEKNQSGLSLGGMGAGASSWNTPLSQEEWDKCVAAELAAFKKNIWSKAAEHTKGYLELKGSSHEATVAAELAAISEGYAELKGAPDDASNSVIPSSPSFSSLATYPTKLDNETSKPNNEKSWANCLCCCGVFSLCSNKESAPEVVAQGPAPQAMK